MGNQTSLKTSQRGGGGGGGVATPQPSPWIHVCKLSVYVVDPLLDGYEHVTGSQ